MIVGHLPELVLVLVLALVFFGPKRLPEVGSAVGQTIRDFKKGMSQLTDEMPAATSQQVVEPGTLPFVVAASHTEPEPVIVDIQDRPVACWPG